MLLVLGQIETVMSIHVHFGCTASALLLFCEPSLPLHGVNAVTYYLERRKKTRCLRERPYGFLLLDQNSNLGTRREI